MKLIDTCGWIEELTAGPLAERFSPDLQHPEALIVPTVVQYELYKWICRERDEMTALAVIDITRQCQVIPLDTSLALLAAGLARQYQLSVADAIIYATARQEAVSTEAEILRYFPSPPTPLPEGEGRKKIRENFCFST